MQYIIVYDPSCQRTRLNWALGFEGIYAPGPAGDRGMIGSIGNIGVKDRVI